MSSFCNAKASNIFLAKNINIFAKFQDRNFNVTLANNFIVLNKWAQVTSTDSGLTGKQRRPCLQHLIWVNAVCSGISVPILRVYI